MNILLTSVGRRNYMVEYFQQALAKCGGGKVFALNSEINSPGLHVADKYSLCPLIYDENYETFLFNYCQENNIKLVVSLFDIELPLLSRFKDAFASKGITIVVAEEWLSKTCNDKWLTQSFLKENGFNVVPSFLSITDFLNNQHNINYPVFVKPRWGMGSIGIQKAKNQDEVKFYFKAVKEEVFSSYLKYESKDFENESVMIQQALPGHEHGLDVINDLNGNYITTVVKRKIAMRSGETDVAETIDSPILMELGRKLSAICQHPGNMDVDVFFDGTTAYILEMNPRFGGGYPFTHAAGIDLPLAMVKWAKGEVLEESFFKPKIGVKAMKGISIIVQKP
ncbi:MAG: ATP-grasp domain-containing protein [Cytophagales bacterium]